jgi:type III restriction enzyme
MKKVVRDWLDQCLVCKGGTNHGLLMFRETADMGCERMIQAIVVSAVSSDTENRATSDTEN